MIYDLFKQMLGSGPVYVALGNHDTHNEYVPSAQPLKFTVLISSCRAQDAPHSLGGDLASQFQWNYDHVAGLWAHEDWLPSGAVSTARATYGAYSVQRADGLRIITLNTDFWYRDNLFNYFNLTQKDPSGMLRFLTDELQDAEDDGDRGK